MLLAEVGLAILLGYLLTALVYQNLQFIYGVKAPSFLRYMRAIHSGSAPRDLTPMEERDFAFALWLALTLMVAVMFFAADAVVSAAPFLKRFYLWSMRTFGLQVTQLLLACAVLLLGWAAFKLKEKHQRTYGVVEVLFAWVAAVITARQMKPGMDWSGQVATLVGAVYIVSRGLNNIKDGAIAKHNDD